jgi:hypothetical protein
MLKEFRYRIKVSAKVKYVPIIKRVIPELKMRETYYVSYGGNYAYPCFISEIVKEFADIEVWVQLRVPEKDAYYREGGKMVYNPYTSRLIYAYNLGRTPDDAVRHMI